MLAQIGQMNLYISIILAWMVFFLWKKKSRRTIELLNYFSLLLVWLSFIVLIMAFLAKDYSYYVVYNFSNEAMSTWERLSATWVSRQGVMILWGAYMISISVFVMNALRDKIENKVVSLALKITFLMSAVILSFAVSTRPDAFTILDYTPLNGLGLTPSLLSFWNLLHPPIAFLAYSSFIFPFAAGIAILYHKSSDVEVPHKLYWLMDLFMILGWCLTSIMIIAGSLWGYEENWSGFWAWDPVEIAALVMWTTSSLYFHAKSHTDIGHPLRAFTATLGWIGVAFASFIVRSGLLAGLHSYTSSAQLYVFGTMLILTIAGVVIGLMKSKVGLIPPNLLKYKDNKNKVAMVTFWLLVTLSIANVIGLVLQIANVVINDNTNTPYYFYIPINGILLLVLGVLLPFCDISLKKYINKKDGTIIIIFAVISLTIFLLTKIGSIYLLIAVILLGVVILIQISDITNSIRKKSKLKKIGRQLIHLTTLLMLLSYFTADFSIDVMPLDVEQNKIMIINEYDIKINATRTFEGSFSQARVEVMKLSGDMIDVLILEEGLYKAEYWNSGDWVILPFYDLFFHIKQANFDYGIDPNANLSIEVHRVPGANIFRMSFIILIVVTFVGSYAAIKQKPKE